MYSNTQNAWRSEPATSLVFNPRSVSVTTSPGWTSRKNVAPIRSNAHDSLATQYAGRPPAGSSIIPSASGRRPCGSRNATTDSSVSTTVEKAPRRRGSTSATASSIRSAGWVASSAAMISESEVDLNGTSRPRNSAWSSTALIRLPLWASASVRLSSRTIGCVFSHSEAPVVE